MTTSDTAPLEGAQTETTRLVWVGALAALLSFAAYQIVAVGIMGGQFEYPIDDVYIHLAMSEQIAAGGYGVNPGELASASSSILYPLLLAPFAGTPLHLYMPLLLNALGVALSGGLFARAILFAGLGEGPNARVGQLLILIGPAALNMTGAAYMGMEHGLHVAASLAVAVGMIRFVETGKLGPALILGCILGPALRFEGAGLSVAALGLLVVHGRIGAALLLGAATAAPVAAFVWWMTSLGLNPLPNSVMIKLGEAGQDSEGFVFRRLVRLIQNLFFTPAVGMLAVALIWIFALPFLRGPKRGSARFLVLTVVAVGIAHLTLSRLNIMYRYEIYAITFMAALTIYIARRHMRGVPAKLFFGLTAIAVVSAAVVYVGAFAKWGAWSPRSIHAQQGQMARLAHEYWQQPIGINDLGYVTYQSPIYVLDLYGLGNTEAMEVRTRGDAQNWMDPLAEAADARLIMIYDHWFEDATSPDWVFLGRLHLVGPTGFLGGRDVEFFATRPEHVEAIVETLERFVPTLPESSRFEFAEGVQSEG